MVRYSGGVCGACKCSCGFAAGQARWLRRTASRASACAWGARRSLQRAQSASAREEDWSYAALRSREHGQVWVRGEQPARPNESACCAGFLFVPPASPRLAGAQAAILRRASKAIDGTRRPQVLKDVIRNVPSSWAASSVELFKAADLDESGEIDREELAAMFKRAGTNVTDSQISEIMRVISSDKKGTVITWPDFASAVELVECDAPPTCTSPQRRAPGRARSPRRGCAGCSCNRSWRATTS